MTNNGFNKMLDKYNMGKSSGCVELGYDDKPVITANWNNIPDKLLDALENMGYACEWEDEWAECDECYKSFRTSPNSYGWSMSGHIFDGYTLCVNCIDILELCESFENNPRMAINPTLWDKYSNEIKSLYELIQDDFENGLHPYQTDNPADILKKYLASDSSGRYLFVIDGISQFDLGFSIYRKKDL